MEQLNILIDLPDRVTARQIRRTDNIAEYVLSNGMTEIFYISHDDNGDEVYANSNQFTMNTAWNFPTRFKHLIAKRWYRLTGMAS